MNFFVSVGNLLIFLLNTCSYRNHRISCYSLYAGLEHRATFCSPDGWVCGFYRPNHRYPVYFVSSWKVTLAIKLEKTQGGGPAQEMTSPSWTPIGRRLCSQAPLPNCLPIDIFCNLFSLWLEVIKVLCIVWSGSLVPGGPEWPFENKQRLFSLESVYGQISCLLIQECFSTSRFLYVWLTFM